MAEEKKSDKPVEKVSTDPFVEIIWFILSILVLLYLLNGFIGMFGQNGIFAGGISGLISEKTVPLSSVANPKVGDRVITSKDGTALYDAPGGKQIGTLKKGVHGKILGGPVNVGGVRYWHVKFDNGDEGWAAEDNLDYIPGPEPNFFVKTIRFFAGLISYLKYGIILLSVVLAGWVAFLYRKISRLIKAEAELMYISEEIKSPEHKNPQWERILFHSESVNENDWRLAILEADIMLGDMLEKMALPGESIGDKLKAVEKSDFLTVENAWEAHKVRNQIAHEGVSFILNQHEAKRVIGLYQSVFQEFQII
ncbi:MAG TPA: hypothetical protein VJG67_01515 [Candidatus Paceibacterota bacterium]